MFNPGRARGDNLQQGTNTTLDILYLSVFLIV